MEAAKNKWIRICLFSGLVFCLLSAGCSSTMVQTGTNSWDMGIRTGVTSHYYSYSGM